MNRLKQSLALFALKNRQLLMFAFCAFVFCLAMPNRAHAMAIDFSDITSQWGSIKTFLIFVVSCIAAGLIITSIFKLIGRDWGEAIMYATGGALCAYGAAHAAGWIGSETGAAI